MEINNLKMISFRNHKKTNISFDPGLTIIWGKNGSGKTSILEAIHSLSFGKSFRTNNKSDLIKKGYKVLGNEIFKTWSCYLSGKVQCGKCESCNNRKIAFAKAKIEDKTKYLK